VRKKKCVNSDNTAEVKKVINILENTGMYGGKVQEAVTE
jgi:ribosomal protein S28E/S33